MSQLPIGRRVARWRVERGMSQQVLADLIGKSMSWLEKVERGERGLDKLSVIYTIAAVLQIDPRTLLSDHPESAPSEAPSRRTTATKALPLGTSRRVVDVLMRRHIGPVTDGPQLARLRQLLALVCAVMAAEGVEPSSRHRVIATLCTMHRSRHDHPTSVNDKRRSGPP